jgi:hypothetical protein
MQLSIHTQTQPCQLEDTEYGVWGMGDKGEGLEWLVVSCGLLVTNEAID